MVPYVLLLVFGFTGCFIEINKQSLRIGSSQRISSKNSSLSAFFISFFLLLAFRHETIGRDLLTYKNIFHASHNTSFSSLFSQSELLYFILNWIIGNIFGNYQVFLAIVAIICIIPIAFVYCEDRRFSFLKIVIFVNLPTFVMMFSGLRQAIAISIGTIAYHFVRKKKLVPFLLTVLIAFGFHKSSFMLLPMYWIYQMRFKRKHLWIIVPSMVTLYLFNGTIFNYLLTFIDDYADKYDATAGVTGAVNMLILFGLFVIFSYVLSDESTMTEEMFGLRNFLLVCFALQCFAPVHNLAMRLNYYYILFIPIAVAKVFHVVRPQYRQVAKLAHVVLCVFFTVYFLYTSYVSCVTGISDLDTFPYVPFWRE